MSAGGRATRRPPPIGALALTAIVACAHPSGSATGSAPTPAAPPAAAAAPPPSSSAAAPRAVDPERCYSRDRVPVVPPGQTAAAQGSLFGRDTALGPGASNPNGGSSAPGADLDKEIVRRIIRRHINEVKACYEPALSAHPYLAGTITVAFLIPPSGIVSETHVARSTMGYPAVEECVARAMCGWEFPRPLDGRSVVITYPYKMSPAPPADGP